MTLRVLAELLDARCSPDTAIADLDLSDTAMKRVLFYRAQINDDRWPYNSLRGHRYALRQLVKHGPMSQSEYLSCYESVISQYVNDPNKQ